MKKSCLIVFFLLLFTVTAYGGSWEADGGGRWYRNDDGSDKRNEWLLEDGKWYFFNSVGRPLLDLKPGWVKDAGGWKYYLGDGMVMTGVQELPDNRIYVFGSDGYMFADVWLADTYYLGADGALVISDYAPDGRYLGPDGKVCFPDNGRDGFEAEHGMICEAMEPLF